MSKLLAIYEAVKAAASIFAMVTDAYLKYRERKIIKHYEEKTKVLEKLITRIENATTDQERADLARRLANLI